MASIYRRKDGKGWRAVIRIKNHPTVCDRFDRKEEAEDWVRDTERAIKLGLYTPNRAKEKTVADLIDLYIKDAVQSHHKAAKDSIRQLNYFRDTIGKYALAYITPELKNGTYELCVRKLILCCMSGRPSQKSRSC